MKIGYFMINNEEIDIYDDGEIYSYGRKVGKIYDDGDIYLHNKKIGKVYNDGEIWINGRKEGQLYEDGQLWLSGRQVGNIDRPSRKDSYTPTHSSAPHSSRNSSPSSSYVPSGVPDPWVVMAILFTIFVVVASLVGSYWMLSGKMVEIFFRNQHGWGNIMVYALLILFYGSIVFAFYLQYKWSQDGDAIFIKGLLIQACMIEFSMVFSDFILGGIIHSLGDLIVGFLLGLIIGSIPAIIGTIIIKVFSRKK